ncbi:MAG: AI-2E family transporter [Steroidobacteraceae bacterium]
MLKSTKEDGAAAGGSTALTRLLRNGILVALGLLLLWLVADWLLIIFAGILLAILLRGLSFWLSAQTRLPIRWSLVAVVVAILVIAAGVVYFIAPNASQQLDQLVQQLPVGLHRIEQELGRSSWGNSLLKELQPGSEGRGAVRAVAGQLFGVASTTFGILAAFIVIIFVGLYLAAEPGIYVRGTIRLFPPHRRARIIGVLHQIAHALRWWLIGRIISMTVIGIVTALGLWLIGVHLALTLGILAGLLSFVPYIGSVSSAVPAILIALTQSTGLVLYVIVLYVIIHIAEGYILMPLMQKKMVHMPPALTLSMQVVLGAVLGILGIALATPLTAGAVVAIRMLYVEDVLHDPDSGKSIDG